MREYAPWGLAAFALIYLVKIRAWLWAVFLWKWAIGDGFVFVAPCIVIPLIFGLVWFVDSRLPNVQENS